MALDQRGGQGFELSPQWNSYQPGPVSERPGQAPRESVLLGFWLVGWL